MTNPNVIPDEFLSAAFWVTLTFSGVIIWLAAQAYWSRVLLARIKDVEKQMQEKHKECSEKIEALRSEMNDTQPQFPWLRKVKV